MFDLEVLLNATKHMFPHNRLSYLEETVHSGLDLDAITQGRNDQTQNRLLINMPSTVSIHFAAFALARGLAFAQQLNNAIPCLKSRLNPVVANTGSHEISKNTRNNGLLFGAESAM